jgi:hypothetical protein
MESFLQRKYKLPKSAARSISAEARSILKIQHDIMWTRALESTCVKIAEARGFLENGKLKEKKPARTEWFPSTPVAKSNDLRSRVAQILSEKRVGGDDPKPSRNSPSSSPTVSSKVSSKAPSRRTVERISNSRLEPKLHLKSRDKGRPISHDRGLVKPAKTDRERPRRSRFVPSARVSRVLHPIAEASLSADEESAEESCTSRRRRVRRYPSTDTAATSGTGTGTVSSRSTTGTLAKDMVLREHILRVVGDCTDFEVVQDQAKGFRYTDFDQGSLASGTLGTDCESVSSSHSGRKGTGSPTKSPRTRKTVSMGAATVKQLATRFEIGAADRRITAPAPPMRRYSNDDLDLPPIRVIETHANALSPAFVPV